MHTEQESICKTLYGFSTKMRSSQRPACIRDEIQIPFIPPHPQPSGLSYFDDLHLQATPPPPCVTSNQRERACSVWGIRL